MIQSMTAFASRTGQHGPHSWAWEMRGVNSRGLDLRLRLPDGIDRMEAALRAALAARLARGNVTVGLRLSRDDAQGSLQLDSLRLDGVLAALGQIQNRALDLGITLGRPTAADVLAQRGVQMQGPGAETPDLGLSAALIADIAPLIDDFCTMRASEGAALHHILTGQINMIAALTEEAAALAEARRPQARATLTAALQRVLTDIPDLDDARLTQELALLAVKSDITEEIDRLQAHVAAARRLLSTGGPQGRKLDFLTQEFNREANTLCSKSGSTDLTRIGLDLKTAIDQMREQIQNVE